MKPGHTVVRPGNSFSGFVSREQKQKRSHNLQKRRYDIYLDLHNHQSYIQTKVGISIIRSYMHAMFCTSDAVYLTYTYKLWGSGIEYIKYGGGPGGTAGTAEEL